MLATIDVKEVLKNKLNVEFPRYVVLGACSPIMAHEALQAEKMASYCSACFARNRARSGRWTYRGRRCRSRDQFTAQVLSFRALSNKELHHEKIHSI